jgi:hypothetical protein
MVYVRDMGKLLAIACSTSFLAGIAFTVALSNMKGWY